MNKAFNFERSLLILDELYKCKCKEVKWLIESKKYSLKVIEKRQQEADKLKESLEGITNVTPTDLFKPQFYSGLDKCMVKHAKSDPSLKGFIIILGPDKPELFQEYSRITWNIPISIFRN